MSFDTEVLTVSELLKDLKSLINSNESFKNVALIGEVSNFSAHRSGHFYFNLKDDRSRIACVMFKTRSQSVKFKPKDGDRVILVGRLDVFETSGSVQLYVERMNLDGLGDLHVQFEALKKDFEKRGYFDQSLKKPLAQYPRSIAIITGSNSAAYADIHRTLKERWPSCKLYDLLSLVQGTGAKEAIVSRIQEANALGVDTIILARGGGSIEDLWAFNEPEVVEAIHASSIPIVCGVGHEVDVTLADFAADYRAATPTAAAVIATPNRIDLLETLRNFKNKTYIAVRNKLRNTKTQHDYILKTSYLHKPSLFYDKKQEQLDFYHNQFSNYLKDLQKMHTSLASFSLEYSLKLKHRIQKEQHDIASLSSFFISTLNYEVQNTKVTLDQRQLLISRSLSTKTQEIKRLKNELEVAEQQITKAMVRLVDLKNRGLNDILKTLDTLSPLKTMSRGYTLTYQNGNLVKSAHSLHAGSRIEIQFSDGKVNAQILEEDNTNERI